MKDKYHPMLTLFTKVVKEQGNIISAAKFKMFSADVYKPLLFGLWLKADSTLPCHGTAPTTSAASNACPLVGG